MFVINIIDREGNIAGIDHATNNMYTSDILLFISFKSQKVDLLMSGNSSTQTKRPQERLKFAYKIAEIFTLYLTHISPL